MIKGRKSADLRPFRHAAYTSLPAENHMQKDGTSMRNPEAFSASFVLDKDGAVTVDWVVLTAAVMVLGITAFVSAKSGVASLTGSVKTTLSETEIETP